MKETQTFLRPLIGDVVVRANSGVETYQSCGIFTGGIYGAPLPPSPGVPTPLLRASLSEVIADGKFSSIFKSLGEDRMYWSEAQVIQFYRDTVFNDALNIWGHPGPGVSFELAGGYVSIVYLAAHRRPGVYNYWLEADINWRAADFRRRIVSLQPQKEKMKTVIIASPFLAPLVRDIFIRATVGSETSDLRSVFPCGIYGEVPPMTDEKRTPEARAALCEIIASGKNFAEIFGSLGKDRNRWTKSQVAVFRCYHPNLFEQDGHSTFFELEGGLVACVFLTARGRFGIHFYPLKDGTKWLAGKLRVALL